MLGRSAGATPTSNGFAIAVCGGPAESGFGGTAAGAGGAAAAAVEMEVDGELADSDLEADMEGPLRGQSLEHSEPKVCLAERSEERLAPL